MKTLLAALALLAVASTSQAAFDYYLVNQYTINGNNFCVYSNGGTYAMGMSLCPITIRL